MEAYMAAQLKEREKLGNLRALKLQEGRIDFSSNDYLGFSCSQTFKQRLFQEWQNHLDMGLGAGGSRLLTGHCSLMDEIEMSIAAFHHAETALLFNSGYHANLGLISTIVKPKDSVFYDSQIHASSHEGMRLSKCRQIPWRHNDVEHLLSSLKRTVREGCTFVIVESLYSCDGTLTPLGDVVEVCRANNAFLIVDEAHATGIIGLNGEGLVQHLGLEGSVFARIHTFSKALGCYGAVILGSSTLRNFLINFCRSFIYTTALPFPILLSIRQAYQQLPHAGITRSYLENLIRYFKSHGDPIRPFLLPSDTPIQAIVIPGNTRVRSIAESMQTSGFDVRPLLSPTVKKGSERLRICLHAFNTVEEVDTLMIALENVLTRHS